MVNAAVTGAAGILELKRCQPLLPMKIFRDQAIVFIGWYCCVMLLCTGAAAQVIPLPNAFAHNDYRHKRPLFDALGSGFTHIEADIYLWRGRLLVTHRIPILKKHSNIETLYLQPLFNRLNNPADSLARTALDTIVLLVDIKSNAERTYLALKKQLLPFKSILSSCDNGKVIIRNLTIVLSGHRPINVLENETTRFVFADEDLRKSDSVKNNQGMYTMASCKYSRLISWKGKGQVPEAQKFRLNDLVLRAHAEGKKVRLWASPENEKVWAFLRICGVDLINTDKIKVLKRYFNREANIF